MNNDIESLLENYFDTKKAIFEYFNYEEDWQAFPIDDCTGHYWMRENNTLIYSDEKFLIDIEDQDIEDQDIEDQKFVNAIISIHPGKDYTMILLDTQCDGNIFLSIFDNKKEVKRYE